MKTYRLKREQRIKADLNELCTFFSDPANLDALTPDDMGFKIISPTPIPKMYEGQIIEYKVSPLLNIPLYWKTKITEVSEGQYFVDEQKKGPYKYWRHVHTFEDKGDHVLMTDDLEYALPLGILGQIAHSIFVKNKLNQIFNYRFEKVDQIFNKTLKRSGDLGKSIAV